MGALHLSAMDSVDTHLKLTDYLTGPLKIIFWFSSLLSFTLVRHLIQIGGWRC